MWGWMRSLGNEHRWRHGTPDTAVSGGWQGSGVHKEPEVGWGGDRSNFGANRAKQALQERGEPGRGPGEVKEDAGKLDQSRVGMNPECTGLGRARGGAKTGCSVSSEVWVFSVTWRLCREVWGLTF